MGSRCAAVGETVVVRNRPALVTNSDGPTRERAGEDTLVRVRYTDGELPREENVLWGVEASIWTASTWLSAKQMNSPLAPATFRGLMRAARWGAHTPLRGVPGTEMVGESFPWLTSPITGRIAPYDYQLVPLLKALEMPQIRMLIADDVGLGKTVEAGLILSELVGRRRVRKILVLCPPGLRQQWQRELWEKFGFSTNVLDGPTSRRMEKVLLRNPWDSHERMIASFYYMRDEGVLRRFEDSCRSQACPSLPWDLLIVDEAHHFAPPPRGPESDLTLMLRRLTRWFEHRIFMTATPHNGHRRSFTGLLEILDPVHYRKTSELSRTEKARLGCTVVRRMKSDLAGGLGSAAFRGRKVTGVRVDPERQERELMDAFRRWRTGIASWGRFHVNRRLAPVQFALEVLGKRLLSSVASFAMSYSAFLKGTESALSQREAEGGWNPEGCGDLHGGCHDDRVIESNWRRAAQAVGIWMARHYPGHKAKMERISEALRVLGIDLERESLQVPNKDSRYEAFRNWMASQSVSGSWEDMPRILLFTEYKTTLDYLNRRLLAADDEAESRVCKLFGGMGEVERNRVIERFLDPSGPARLLLATDTGSEGLNLHKDVSRLFHFDIPWNPARLEQRCGRLDRHGQREDVQVFHFDCRDFSELRFLGKVARKVHLMRDDLGKVGPVLAEEVKERLTLVPQRPTLFPGMRTQQNHRSDVAGAASRPQAELSEELCRTTVLADGRAIEQAVRRELCFMPTQIAETAALVSHEGDRLGRPSATLSSRPSHLPEMCFSGGTEDVSKAVPDTHEVRWLPRDIELVSLTDPLVTRLYREIPLRFGGGSRWTALPCDLPAALDAAVLLFIESVALNLLGHPVHWWVAPVMLPLTNANRGWKICRNMVEPKSVRKLVGWDPVRGSPEGGGGDSQGSILPGCVEAVLGPEAGCSSGEYEWVALSGAAVVDSILPQIRRFLTLYERGMDQQITGLLASELQFQMISARKSLMRRREELGILMGSGRAKTLARRLSSLLEEKRKRGFILAGLRGLVDAEIAELEGDLSDIKVRSRELEEMLNQREVELVNRVIPGSFTLACPVAVMAKGVAVLLRG